MQNLKRIPAMLFLVVVILAALSLTGTFAQEEPSSRCGLVTLNEKPLTLAGKELKVGDKAPSFILLNDETHIVEMGEFKGKIMVISVMPSIDTPT
ncbi:MAG: hypothetical protein JW971_03295 [Synergistales bacterium]|nr:hypothetical protein [Synergistales bacterium]